MKFRELKVGDIFYFKNVPQGELRKKIAYRKYTDYPISFYIRKGRGESEVVKYY